jgi:hypothetical protein
MSNKIAKLAVVAAGAALSLLAIEAGSAQAAVITYNYSFTLPTSLDAPAAGAAGTGTFSYESTLLNPSAGFQPIPVISATINLLGQTFNQTGARGLATVDFFSGVFSGLAFEVNTLPDTYPLASLAISRSQVAVFDQSFNSAQAPVSYSIVPPTNVIPTPALLPGLVGLGVAAARKRQAKAA